MFFYNIGIWCLVAAVKLSSLFKTKARLMVRGRKDVFARLEEEIKPDDRVIWIHCASLGEFEQGRPVIEAIKQRMAGHKVLLTFFSPSGYEIRKDYPGADLVLYLPFDTPRNARRFIRAAHPQAAVFIKYEFWLNYLEQLRASGSRTFVVSAIFHERSVFFRWYGGLFRKALKGFERIFVQDEKSEKLLSSINIGNVTVSGDTRFDRVAAVAAGAKKIEAVERFAGNSKVFVAGSTWPPDEELILQLIAKHPDIKFIIAPHEIENERIDAFIRHSADKAVRYTRSAGSDYDPDSARVMVIDTIGILSSVYRYGAFGYIGGGFGAGIHNTLEAAAAGLPVAFGPNYGRFREAVELTDIGAARPVTDFTQLDDWLASLTGSPQLYAQAKAKALSYVAHNTGATETILTAMFPVNG